ncbi:phospholipase-like protein [Tanacetum coccineum]
MEEWVKKLEENADIDTRNQSASLKNLETQIEQLTREFHTKAANEINNLSFDQCKAVYANKKTPLNNGQHKVSLVNCTQIVQEKIVASKVLPSQLPPKEMNLGNFTLPCTIGSLNFYDVADLGVSVNVIPKSMFEHLKLAQLKKTDMLVEMTDMTKRSPIGIVENVLVKIDKFLFPSDFYGIGGDRITFDMDKKIHNFTTHVGEIYMINSINNEESLSLSSTLSDKSSRFEKSDNLQNNYDNHIQERRSKKTKILKSNTNLPNIHFYKHVKQICNGILKVWPTCDPTLKACNRGIEVYGMNEEGNLKRWYCYLDDDRGSIKGGGLSLPEFLLVKYEEVQEKELIWDNRYEEWCNENLSLNTPTSRFTSIQEDYKPRPKDYPFKDCLFTKVGHTKVSKPVKKALLKTWLLDCFQEELVKDLRSRSFDVYKWMFDLEVDQLADEYELGIGKKGQMLDVIWENF